MRITVFCPETMISQANHLAMVLAQSEADVQTYGAPRLVFDGELYSSASFVARPEWIIAAQQPLVRPTWDTGEIIDMDAARAVQVVLDFWLPDTPGFPPTLSPNRLVAIGGVSDNEARELLDVSFVPFEL